jgi:hypothetical protein
VRLLKKNISLILYNPEGIFVILLSSTQNTLEDTAMFLRVQYQNSGYDYVNATTLDRLIASKQIKKFLRLSQNEWIDIERGPIRGQGLPYVGPKRRQSQTASP